MDLPAECVGRLPPPEFLSPPDLPLLVSQDLLAELAEAPFLPESLHRSLLPAVERLSLPEPPSPMALKRLAPSESLSPPDLPLLALPAYMLRIFVCISASALAKWSGGNHPYAGK
ncbi:MAG: hypothetical protein V8R50_01895 [Clostridia bacterium]